MCDTDEPIYIYVYIITISHGYFKVCNVIYNTSNFNVSTGITGIYRYLFYICCAMFQAKSFKHNINIDTFRVYTSKLWTFYFTNILYFSIYL